MDLQSARRDAAGQGSTKAAAATKAGEGEGAGENGSAPPLHLISRTYYGDGGEEKDDDTAGSAEKEATAASPRAMYVSSISIDRSTRPSLPTFLRFPAMSDTGIKS